MSSEQPQQQQRQHNSGKPHANQISGTNPGVTSYDPDAIESYQFTVSSKSGDLLVGVNGKELVGFALEKEAPSTSFFFETLEQVGRCVAICSKKNSTSSSESSTIKEWIVAVGGDQKFVDIYNVTMNNHVGRCQAYGRIGPFPKRIQSVTFLNEEKQLLLIGDRFGDIYHNYAIADAKPELMTKRERQSSTTPRHNSNGGDDASATNSQQQQSGNNNNNNNNNNSNFATIDKSNLHFALQHLGILSSMRQIPCACPSNNSTSAFENSPLLVTCDSDHHVRVNCGRRPGLVLQNLWPEYRRSNSNSENKHSSSSQQQDTSSTAPFASTAGKTVSSVSYFAPNNNHVTLVTGRCDGTLSAWGLVRRNVEMLDINGTATCGASFGNNGPVVGVACLSIPSSSSEKKQNIVIFAKADSSRLYGWIPNDSVFALPSSSSSSSNNNNNNNNKSRIRDRHQQDEEEGSCFTIRQAKDSTIKKDKNFSSSSSSSSSNIIALYGCSAISPTAVIVVFRDASVELFDIVFEENSDNSNISRSFSCKPIPFPASGSHTRVPLPFSVDSKEQLSRVKPDSIYSIITNHIATEEWQNKYTGKKKGDNNKDDEDEE